jgi:two-component system, LytTR family, sensor kinase
MRSQISNQATRSFSRHDTDRALPGREQRFTLSDWRIWAASFGFFWSLLLCGAVSMLSFQRVGGGKFMSEEILILPVIQDTIFAILAPLVFVIAARYPIQRKKRVARSLLYVGGGVLFTLAHVFIRVLCYPAWEAAAKRYDWALFNWPAFHFSLHWPALQRLFLWNLVEDIFAIYLPIVVIAHAALYYRQFREKELRAAQLQRQLSDAKLLALKNQLQPHFLFNTLHSISSLMLTDVGAADTMIARLSDLLRMSLQSDGQHLTSLKRELEFTQAYLDIEKIRFGQRLAVNFEIAPETLDITVPHLLLQPLVENSIKHGIARSTAGGEVTVVAVLSGDRLSLSIKDRVPDRADALRSTAPGIGIGLKGTRERLRTLYGDEQRFETRAFAGGEFEVQILLPILDEDRLMLYGSRVEGVVAAVGGS